MNATEQLRACLNLMRRLPPHQQRENLEALLHLAPPDVGDELVQCVDVPLEEAIDPETNQPFLLCEYNRDGASHRSPWSNKYFPAPPSSSSAPSLFYPSDHLRALEVEANAVFRIYRELYYDGQGVSSVYIWALNESDEGGSGGSGGVNGSGFAACFAIKKGVGRSRAFREGKWDSMHVVEVQPTTRGGGLAGPGAATYKLTTTVQVSLFVDNPDVGEACLAGVVTRTTEATHALVSSEGGHVGNMGRMIEDMEIALRGELDALYVQRTREIVNSVRKVPPPLPPLVTSGGGGVGGRRKGQAVPPPRLGANAASAEHTNALFAAIAKRGQREGEVLEG